MGKIRWLVLEDWRRSPFTQPSTARGSPFSPVAMPGPIGANVSNPLHRVYCDSRFCRSRAVTSFTQISPRMYSHARALGTRCARRPITTPTSAS